jgi:hypothetical protein
MRTSGKMRKDHEATDIEHRIARGYPKPVIIPPIKAINDLKDSTENDV